LKRRERVGAGGGFDMEDFQGGGSPPADGTVSRAQIVHPGAREHRNAGEPEPEQRRQPGARTIERQHSQRHVTPQRAERHVPRVRHPNVAMV
jgi:hypothetical protein